MRLARETAFFYSQGLLHRQWVPRAATLKIFDLWNSWYFPYSVVAPFSNLHTIYLQLVILESTKPKTEYCSAITGLVCFRVLPITAVPVRFVRRRKERDMEHKLR